MGTDSLFLYQAGHNFKRARPDEGAKRNRDCNLRLKKVDWSRRHFCHNLQHGLRNVVLFKNGRQISSSLNRRNKRCKMWGSLSENLVTEKTHFNPKTLPSYQALAISCIHSEETQSWTAQMSYPAPFMSWSVQLLEVHQQRPYEPSTESPSYRSTWHLRTRRPQLYESTSQTIQIACI